MNSSLFDYAEGKHHKTRAVGQLWIGPLQSKRFDNRVIGMSLQEVEFKNSNEAERFIERQRKRLADKDALMGQRRMKTRSISSD
jgi:hypothetical protein